MNFRVALTKTCILFLLVTCCYNTCFAQKDLKKQYLRYLDSAYSKLTTQPDTAVQYLDSIPRPLDKYIKGHLGRYYQIKALIHDSKGEQTELFQNFLLSLQFAEKEVNYDVAGNAALELFYNLYISKKDSLAFEYLEKAENNFKKANNKYGILDVMQAPALMEFYSKNYERSNALILPKLEYYKTIKEDRYYYMFPLFMLSYNYYHLGDYENAQKYYTLFKTIKNDKTIPPSLYKKHLVTLLICKAEIFFRTKQLDSVKYYFSEAKYLRQYMNTSDVKNYYNNLISFYDHIEDEQGQKIYADSLDDFQEKLLDKAMSTNFNVSQSLIDTNEDLMLQEKKKKLNRTWLYILITLLIGLIAFVAIRYKKIKERFSELIKRKKEYNYLQENHEKLKAKTKGLESFIEELKVKIKQVAAMNDEELQRQEIKELYKNIRQNSSAILTEGDNHFQLINKLNIDFFNELSQKHPELNETDRIICYYLLMGFKNKEIAPFLSSSVRAVESRRYRISKKIGLDTKSVPLLDYLTQNFNTSSE